MDTSLKDALKKAKRKQLLKIIITSIIVVIDIRAKPIVRACQCIPSYYVTVNVFRAIRDDIAAKHRRITRYLRINLHIRFCNCVM